MTQRTWRWLALGIALLALAASANSLANGFAYDDVTLISASSRTHSLTALWREFTTTYWPGGDGYRPLTIIAWRVEWAVGNGSPLVFHAVNVVLHVAGAVALFWLATAILPIAPAWIASALYAVHPVHVEAIANVVGQSELAVALLLLLAAGVYLHARRAGELGNRQWIIVGFLYAMACLFKEHAIVLPALLLFAELTVLRGGTPLRERVHRLRTPMLALALIAVVYLWARSAVVIGGASGFQPFVVFQALDLSSTDRVLTMIGASPEWLRLLVWPARLITQYAPQYIEVSQGPSLSLLPGLLVLLGVLGMGVVCWRRSPVTSFGIWWLVITLLPASNFLLPAGFIIAERTLLLPSAGAMLAVASALPYLAERFGQSRATHTVGAAALGVLLVLGVARSVSRNPVWRDNDTVFRAGVIEAPTSYRAHFQLATYLFSIGQYAEGESHYRRAIELFPYDPVMAWAYAEQLRTAGVCERAIPLYRWIFNEQPNARRGHLGYADCLVKNHEYAAAREEALLWLRRGGRISLAREILAAVKAGRDSVRAQ